MTAQLTIANLYPLCTTAAGDEGNARALRQRAEMRGITASIATAYAGKLPPADIYLIGGCWHPELPRIVELLGGPDGLARAVANGAVVFGVDAGFQVLGEWFDTPDGTRHAGLGLLGARTTYAPLVEGPVRTLPNTALGLPAISGYECHRSHTELDADVEPLARLDFGTGNGVPSRSRSARASGVAAISRGSRTNAGSHGSIPNEPDMAAVVRARAAANAHARAHGSGGPRTTTLAGPNGGSATGAREGGPRGSGAGTSGSYATEEYGNSAHAAAHLAHGSNHALHGGTHPSIAADGAVVGHVIGTYLHGPVLESNPELADLLVGWALDRVLEPLAAVHAAEPQDIRATV